MQAMPRPIAAVLTLGCKLNIADSEEIARGLRNAGYTVVDHLCDADAVVVNTCSVTHVADQKSRRLIRSVRRAAPGARVAVTGCFPATSTSDAIRDLGADLVVATRDGGRGEIVAFLGESHRTSGSPAGSPRRMHTRSFIRAQEGCNDICAFCIVPRTRGREASRQPREVVEEVNRSVAEGAREVVITGTQLGAWGRDLVPRQTPHQLIGAILEGTDASRIRFSSLQPQDITSELLALWTDPRLMPHFHLALQSGSDHILRAMRRRYTAADFRDAAARIRAAVPGVAITTDVIAGFPGETDDDFASTLALCRDVAFARVHAFPYSRRARTAAANMPGQLPPDTVRARMTALLSLAGELSAAFRQVAAGTVRPVLWEEERSRDGALYWFGHTDNYIPVYMPGDGLHNRITPVRLGAHLHDGLAAHPLEATP
jgi:threonylcarbamoyladenosine tRNA methylthiotransferase MtaB